MTDQTAKHSGSVRICKICSKTYPAGVDKCPDDGSELARQEKDRFLGTTFLGKYEILSVLGTGGMSIVYKARHIHMERVMALKLLNRELTHDEVARERFRREASAAASLSHQNVVVVHDFGFTEVEPKQAYLVMDCLEGLSLSDLVENNGTLPLARSIEIFKQGLDGLEHAHKKGIIHRDIKPSNLVVITEADGTDLVKLVDFGIAKAAPQEGEKQRQQLTQTGEIFGSPLYMSPEQCNGTAMDPRSDIYSFGCLMYETLSGTPPLIGDTYINTVVKHLQEAPPPFSKTAPALAIPSAIEAVIMKCLEKNPDKRYSTVAELRQALLDAALASGIKGYRAGAVQEVSRKSALSQTFDRVKLAATGGFRGPAKAGGGNLAVAVLIVFGVLGLAAIVFTIPYGTKGLDSLSLYDRGMYGLMLQKMNESIAKANFVEAENVAKQAEAMARKYDDNDTRLEQILRAESKFVDGAELERVRTEIRNIVTIQVKRDYLVMQGRLSKLEVPVSNPAETDQRKAGVLGTGTGALDIAIRLHSRELHTEEQQLLTQAVRVYRSNGLDKAARLADLKTQLGKCYTESQRFDEAEKLYLDAAKIRESVEKRTEEDNKLLSKAYFTLGTFYRDQNQFSEGAKVLRSAIKTAKETKDEHLLFEDLKAYAELLRQAIPAGKIDATQADLSAVKKQIDELGSKLGTAKEVPDSD